MAQPLGVLIYPLLFSSMRVVWRIFDRRYALACTGGKVGMPLMARATLGMVGCALLLTTPLARAVEEVRRYDSNKDGKTDQWEYYQDGVLHRVEVDRNHDGRADESTLYAQGKPVRAELDTDGDGKANQREFYDAQGQTERVEVDRDGDGRMEQRLWYAPGKKP